MRRAITIFSVIATFFCLAAEDAAWLTETFPKQLITASGKKVDTETALKGKTVAVYFSASWCGPCRSFTPELVKFHKKAAKKEKLEIVFVSSDKTSKAMMDYMKKDKMPWLAIPFGDPAIMALKKKLKVNGIPKLVVFNSQGKQISPNARWDIVLLGDKAPAAWKSPDYKPLTYQDAPKGNQKDSKSKVKAKTKKTKEKKQKSKSKKNK